MNKKVLLVSIVLIIMNSTEAKDFGKQAATFPIKEEGFVAMIKRKLANLDLPKVQKQMQDIARKAAEEPKRVAGITKTQKHRTYSFDPSYVLEEDIYLPKGQLLYAKGTTVNPLDDMQLGSRLIFIDGSDPDQVDWVKKQYIDHLKLISNNEQRDDNRLDGIEDQDEQVSNVENKIILIAGKPLELERELKHKIYFDQFGALTSKFGIKFVPALVEQDGKELKVTEIYLRKKR